MKQNPLSPKAWSIDPFTHHREKHDPRINVCFGSLDFPILRPCLRTDPASRTIVKQFHFRRPDSSYQVSLILLAAVVLKSAAFVLFERRLRWPQAVSFMLVANILSTIPGMLTAALGSALGLLAFPTIYAFGVLAEQRCARLPATERTRWLTGHLRIAFMAIYVLSLVFFYLAGAAFDSSRFASYWMLKFFFITFAVVTGMAISAVMEEYAIGWLAGNERKEMSFYTSVIRANYVTLGVVLLVAALEILPSRLAAPHFIVTWLHHLAALLGLG